MGRAEFGHSPLAQKADKSRRKWLIEISKQTGFNESTICSIPSLLDWTKVGFEVRG